MRLPAVAACAPVEGGVGLSALRLGRRHGLAARPELVGTTPPGLPQLFASHAAAMAAAEVEAREHLASLGVEQVAKRSVPPRPVDASAHEDVSGHAREPSVSTRVALLAVLFVAELAINYPVFLVFNVPPWATWAALGGLQVTLLGAAHVIGVLLAGLGGSKGPTRSRRQAFP